MTVEKIIKECVIQVNRIKTEMQQYILSMEEQHKQNTLQINKKLKDLLETIPYDKVDGNGS